MKITKTDRAQVSEVKEVPGLLACRLEYEVKSAKGQMEYAGPKFTSEMWHEVLSFFRWTFTEMQSESQVRLYVNTKLGRWSAWAFPQEARTGISARELPVPETPEQAFERFASWNSEPSDDWLYFGTVHHHCSLSAFQSGTDEANEKNQDGLHITVGRMDSDRHDLHTRFYVGGNCFEPDMSLFWPIDPDLVGKVPPSSLDAIARFQMGEKVAATFPTAWKNNVVEVKRDQPPQPPQLRTQYPDWEMDKLGLEMSFHTRLDQALEEISQRCSVRSIHEEQWLPALQAMSDSNLAQIIVEICVKYKVTPEDLFDEVTQFSFGY